MKKIVHVINELALGGTETALYRLLQSLHQDYQFHVIALRGEGYYSKPIEALGIPVTHLRMRALPVAGLYQLFRTIKQLQPDIVQTWLYHADFIGGLCAKGCGVKRIIWNIRCE